MNTVRLLRTTVIIILSVYIALILAVSQMLQSISTYIYQKEFVWISVRNNIHS